MRFRTKSLKEIYEITGNRFIPLEHQEIIADHKVRTGVYDNLGDRILFDEGRQTYAIPQEFVNVFNDYKDIEELFEL